MKLLKKRRPIPWRLFLKILLGIVVILIIIFSLFQIKEHLSEVSVGKFGGVSLAIEYATTDEEREKGLGGKYVVPEHYGMLFVFSSDERHGFWMKGMLVPLDIFWLNAQGQVVSIAQNVPAESYPHVFYPAQPARYVLETAAGFAQKNNIATGTPLLLKNLEGVSK